MNHINRQYKNPQIIGVSGGSGSGKTTLCKEVMRFCNEDIALVSQDSYYKDFGKLSQTKRNAINFDHTDAIDHKLLLSHLHSLKQSISIEVPEYDFSAHSRTGKVRVLHSASIILVEGIMLFTLPKIRAICDHRVFVHVETDIRFIRRMLRDIKSRGRNVKSVVRQYLDTVKPMHNRHVQPHRETADLIINGLDLKRAVKQFSDFITTIQEDKHEAENFHNYTFLQPGTIFGINNPKYPGPKLPKP